MSGVLCVLAVLQVQPPQVTAIIDRSEVSVGEIVTLTISAEAQGTGPVRILDPILSGLEVQGTSEATHVRLIDGTLHRLLTRELRLVALRPGQAAIGAVRVRQGEAVDETTPLMVTVVTGAPSVAASLPPAIRDMIRTMAVPPADSEVAVLVVVRPDTVQRGEQVDVLTVAWFRRDVRRQLRTPPTLSPPNVQGVWAYPQEIPPGIVASRRSGAQWYDLFVAHQILFPLTEATVRVSPATVRYALPLTYSFLSRELQHEARSDSVTVPVRPFPDADRPAGFEGAAGVGLTVDMTTSTRELVEGAPASVTVTVRGTGNVALWPEPAVQWPAGLRVYPGEARVELTRREGLVAGAKHFDYLVVADSAGTHHVPGPRLDYFDTDRGRYERVSAPPIELVAPPGVVAAASRTLPPPLRVTATKAPAVRIIEALGYWRLAVLLAPLPVALLIVAVPAWRRRRGRAPDRRATAEASLTSLERLDRRFRAALSRLVANVEHREGRALTDALRAAGVEPALAAHAVRARERLQAAVFGPGGTADVAELEAEVAETLRALETAVHTRSRLTMTVGLAAVLAASPLGAQDMPAERLYEAGAYRAAAEAFLVRAASAPRVAAHWYHAGNALYRLGDDGRALVAWVRAARLEPRAADLRRALRLIPRDPVTADMLPVFPLTAAELSVAGAASWILAWVLVLVRRRKVAVVFFGMAVLTALSSWGVRHAYTRPRGVVLDETVPLRGAPYGSAPASRELVRGTGVRIERSEAGWLLVERGGARGWLRTGEVARL